MTIDQIIEHQRVFFRSGATLPLPFRQAALKRLYQAVEQHEEEIAAALTADLGKSASEGFMCETGLVKTEIS